MSRASAIHIDGRRPPWRSLATVVQARHVLRRARDGDLRPPRLPTPYHRQAALLQRLARETCDHHRLLVRVVGAPPRRPAILVANHLSYLDPVALVSVAAALPIAKAEVARWPVIGRELRDAGVLFVDRGAPMSGARALRRGIELLGAGVSLLNFPEGTTSAGYDVLPLHRGIFGLARLTGVDVVPVRVDYDCPSLAWVGDTSFLPHYLRFAGRSLSTATLRFRAAIDPRGGSAEELAARAREALRR